jgi:hypothetical protein
MNGNRLLLSILLLGLLFGCTRSDADQPDLSKKKALTVILRGGNTNDLSFATYANALIGPNQRYLEPIETAKILLHNPSGNVDTLKHNSEGSYIADPAIQLKRTGGAYSVRVLESNTVNVTGNLMVPNLPTYQNMKLDSSTGYLGDTLLKYKYSLELKASNAAPLDLGFRIAYGLSHDAYSYGFFDFNNAWIEVEGDKLGRLDKGLFQLDLGSNTPVLINLYSRRKVKWKIDVYSLKLFEMLLNAQYPLNTGSGISFDPPAVEESDFSGAIGYFEWMLSDTLSF